MNTYWFLELESLAVQRASPPNRKLKDHDTGRCPAHKFPQHTSSQEATAIN